MEYIAAVLPSICIGLIFWLILRSIFRVDRNERAAALASQYDAARWYEELKHRDGSAQSFNPRSPTDSKPKR